MKILLTGMGSIGKRHAQLLRECSWDIDLITYRSDSSKSRNSFNIPEYTELEEALDTDPDIVFITNPTNQHIETALLCAKAGCDLFIEKPLSHDLENIDDLISTVENRDLITYIGCQLRFDPVLIAAQEKLQNEDLGDILSFRATSGSYLPDWRPESDYRESYSADPDRGGGVVLDLIHEIDYSHWLFGPLQATSSEIGYTGTLEIDSEALAEVLVRTSDDIIGSIHLDYCRRRPQRKLEVVCEDGTVIADIHEQTLTLEYPSSTETEKFEYGRDRRFRSQLEYFLEHVESRTLCENDIIEAKRVLQIALNIKGVIDE